MKALKKISFILMSVIIAVLFAKTVLAEDYTNSNKYITNFNNIENWEIGDKMGINAWGTDGYDSSGNRHDFAKDFQIRDNLDFYCCQPTQGTDVWYSGGYTIVGKIVIQGDEIESAKINNQTLQTKSKTSATIKANRIMGEIFSRAKANESSRKRQVNKTETNGDLAMKYDTYQWIVWKYIREWTSTVFKNADLINQFIGNEDNEITHSDYQAPHDNADKIIKELKNKTYTSSSGVSITKANTVTEFDTSKVVGNYTEIGPFKFSYGGTVKAFNVSVPSGSWGNSYSNLSGVQIIKYNGTKATTIDYKNLPNNAEFYLRIKTTDIESKEKIKISIEVEGDAELETTIFVLEANNGQNLIYVDQGDDPTSVTANFEYTLIHDRDLTIQKQDASGNALKVSGIQFEVYDSEGTKVGTLTTNSNGKTGKLEGIKPNQTYTIKETANSAYGYKNRTMSGATITGGSIVSSSATEVKFKLTADATINIKNKLELGKITIHKKDGNTNLAGVEFVVYRHNGYMKVEGKNTITGTYTVSDPSKVTYVTKAEDATKFITGTDGKIVIDKLEIYSAPGEKYNYYVYETANDLYGYKHMTMTDSDITVSGGSNVVKKASSKGVQFNISSSTTVTINNKKQVGELIINKKGANDVALKDVEFVIYQAVTENTGYIKINGTTTNTGGLTIDPTKVSYVSDKSQATKFKTNAQGQIVIKNLEVYSSSGNKYNYYVEEIANNNYGYTNMTIESAEVTGGTRVGVDLEAREVQVTLKESGTTTIDMKNKEEIVDLVINKVDSDTNAALEGVEFAIFRSGYNNSTSGWLKFGNETSIVTPTGGIDASTYKITCVSDVGQATKFKTNSSGKIIINKLEKYESPDKAYTYIIRETANNLHGYKSMVMTDSDVTVSGASKTVDETNKQVEISNITGNVNLTIKNHKQIVNLVIEKVDGESKTALEGVEFAIFQSETGANGWIKLDRNPNTGTIDMADYTVTYVQDISQATKFKTDTSGKIVINNIEVYPQNNQETVFFVQETSNTIYGYKGMVMADGDVTVTGGNKLQVDTSNKKVKVEVLQNDVKVKIENHKKIANLVIDKVDSDTNEGLEGVEFKIYQSGAGANGWLKFGNESQIVTSNQGIDAANYKISYVDEGQATKFITNASGKVVIKNIEVYLQKDQKCKFYVKETSNTLYGYKGMVMTNNDIVVDGANKVVDTANKQIELDVLQNDVNLTIKNHKKILNLELNKVDSETGKGLEEVKFKIYQSGAGANGWLKFGNETEIKTPDGGIDAANYKITYVDESQATTFVTNSSGKVVINNIEVYLQRDQECTFYVRETSNTLYGYKGMITTAIDVTEATKQEENLDISQVNLKVTGNATKTTKVTMKNEEKLIDLSINKTGNDGGLQGVEFKIHQTGTGANGWLKLNGIEGNKIVVPNGGIDVRNYKVEYVDESQATSFITNESGTAKIIGLEMYSGKNQKFDYKIKEAKINLYGYKGMVLQDADVTITGATNKQVNTSTREILFTVKEEIVDINIKNTQYLGDIEITKVDQDNNNKLLPNVEFRIAVNENQYIQLKNANGQAVSTVTGVVTINKNNKASGSEYAVEVVGNSEVATIFKTDSKGKAGVKNLEVYSGVDNNNKPIKFTYQIIEIENPNYGYGSKENVGQKANIAELKETNEFTFTNNQVLGEISLIKEGENSGKHDTEYPNIKLPDVGFVIKAKAGSNVSYLALYDENGKIVPSVRGNITINVDNKASKGEYEVRYYQTTKEYEQMTENEKANITIFLTGDEGELAVNNLEKYERPTGTEYKYDLIEISNPYYGYNKDVEKDNIAVNKGNTTEVDVENIQEKIKISGYVWIENPQGKSNGYDNVYTNNSEGGDKILTDLYTGEAGKLSWNANAEIPVKIQLQTNNGSIVKDKPDEFDKETGEYTFLDIEVENLANYKVVFIYDGLYYAGVVPASELTKQEIANADKVSMSKESNSQREALNSKFTEVGPNGTISNQENVVEYKKEGHVSTVEKLNIDTSVSANTKENGIDFAIELEKLKNLPNTKPVEGIQEINMGLVIREQPDLGIYNDIEKVIVRVNGYDYSYIYATRNQHTVNNTDIDVGVKFENNAYLNTRYTRTIYASDIQAAQQAGAELSVSVVYKMTIVNESRTLTIRPTEIANYYDSRYSIASVEGQVNGYNDENYDGTYKVAKINYTGSIKAGEQDEIRITFNIPKGTVLNDLAQSKSTYHNAAEINKYSSYYANATGKGDSGEYTTDVYKRANQLYAGIDEDSAPGNIEITLVNHPNGGTKILDTSNYEDDTDSAPAFILAIGEHRTISGVVWEDKDEGTEIGENNERLGNGEYDPNEKLISNVQVELWQIANDNTTQLAKYSDGITEAKTVTDGDGKYQLGGNGKGILPGKYFIKYIYNNTSKIVGTSTYINASDYKSTIVDFPVEGKEKPLSMGAGNINIVEHEDGDRWFLAETPRLSDAVDNMSTRLNLNNEDVRYGTYQNVLEADMDANTPIMDMGVEFTNTKNAEGKDEIQVDEEGNNIAFVNNKENIDFGIILRPLVSYVVNKEVASLEIVSQTGASIVAKICPTINDGDTWEVSGIRPSIRGTSLEGIVSGEIEESLLQGATLKIEYDIIITGNSEKDFKEYSYYYHGTGGSTQATIRIKKIVDYLDADMSLDTNLDNSQWQLYELNTLYPSDENYRLISDEANAYIRDNITNYKILVTEAFGELDIQGEARTKLYTSKLLGVTDNIFIYNDVEVIELSGGRNIKECVPGNYIPKHDGGQYGTHDENDSDREIVTFVPPTGTTTNYETYIISISAMLFILAAGTIIIKKVMKKQQG